jgi:hypothetical protein
MHKTSLSRRVALIAVLCAAVPSPVWSRGAPPAPEYTKDGLKLKQQTPQRVIYVRPGASFSQYDRVAILDCYVELQKDWQRNYNSSVVDPSHRVTDADVARIQKALAAEFKKVFSADLEKGGYQLATTAAPDVLVLRPALINVRVEAPDLMTPDVSATIVRSAGQMTLYLELWDSTTNTLLARAMDAEADRQGFAQAASSVSNRAAADVILNAWAEDLRKHLDAVRNKTSS